MEIKTREIVQVWKDGLKARVDKIEDGKPVLAIVVAKDYYEPSKIYINNKVKVANEVGVKTIVVEMVWKGKSVEELRLDLKQTLDKLYSLAHGIIIQVPYPLIPKEEIENMINYKYDVDGFSKIQIGKLVSGDKTALVPATALGVYKLLKHQYDGKLAGKTVAIINRSSLIGKPLFHLLLQADATPTLLHTKTKWHYKHFLTKEADIVVSGCGKRKLLRANDFCCGIETIIDCSMDRVQGIDGVGDCDKEDILRVYPDVAIASGYGHIGLTTCYAVVENTVKAFLIQNRKTTKGEK